MPTQNSILLEGGGKAFFCESMNDEQPLGIYEEVPIFVDAPCSFFCQDCPGFPPLGNEYIYLSPRLESYYLLLHIGFVFLIIIVMLFMKRF